MQFACRFEHLADGGWRVCHSSGDVGTVEVRAPTREAALEKMQSELRYRVFEFCACSGETYRDVQVEIVER